MRTMIVIAALLGLTLASAQAAPRSTTGGGMSFQCTSGQVEVPAQCTCRGIADCAEMGRKGVCGDNPIECDGDRCTCRWALRTTPGGGVKTVPAQPMQRAQ